MAGRNHIPPHALKLGSRPLIDDRRAAAAIHRAPPPSGPAPTSSARPHHIEEHILAQRRDMQALLLDNQRLAATHMALKQELAVAQRDLRHFSATAAAVQADSESQVRDVFEQSLKTEAEARSIAGLSIELGRVRDDIQKLSSDRNELTAKLQAINGDIVMARSELHHLPAIQQEIEVMNREIQRGRAAIEYEKKTQASNLEQSQAMDKSVVSMAREIEKLRAELANAEKRARAAAAAAAAATPSPGYAAGYGNTEMSYGGKPYPDPYALHQLQGGADAGSQYGPGANGSYDMQRPHTHR